MRGARLLWLLLLLPSWILVAGARSDGPPASTVIADDGCSCHSAQPSAGTVVTVGGVPTAYELGKKYTITVSSTTDVANAGDNKGGFLAYATKGTLSKPSTNAAWYQTETSGGASVIKHTLDGDRGNTASNQPWTFDWTAPSTGQGAITFKVYVNRVNGQLGADPGDHWNRRSFTIQAPSPTTPTTPTTPVPTGSATKSSEDSRSPGGSSPTTGDGSPGLPLLVVLFLIAVVALLRSRRA